MKTDCRAIRLLLTSSHHWGAGDVGVPHQGTAFNPSSCAMFLGTCMFLLSVELRSAPALWPWQGEHYHRDGWKPWVPVPARLTTLDLCLQHKKSMVRVTLPSLPNSPKEKNANLSLDLRHAFANEDDLSAKPSLSGCPTCHPFEYLMNQEIIQSNNYRSPVEWHILINSF